LQRKHIYFACLYILRMRLLSERVRHAIEQSGHTPSSVSRVIGCTPAAVLQWISGDTKNIKNDLLFALADATKFEARWIGTGNGPMRPVSTLNHRADDLLNNYAKCDERGRITILTVAEREASYSKDA
jgi:transcriptional regulator with XRE-family HTH domain